MVNPLFLSAATQKPQEPNIDFELDVKVFINSGKCVLHTKDSVKEDEIKLYVFHVLISEEFQCHLILNLQDVKNEKRT